MALDPWIARGAQQVGGDVPNILFERQQADRRNALAQLAQQNVAADNQLERDQFNWKRSQLEAAGQAEQAQAAAKQRVLRAQEVLTAPNPKAAAQALFPELVQGLGEQWGAATDDDVRGMFDTALRQFRPEAGMEAPKAPIPFEQTDEYKLEMVRQQGRERQARLEAGLRPRDGGGGGSGGKPAGNAMGYNERQMAGFGMEQDALITYAANLTNNTPDRIREILRTGGPDAVAKEVTEKGKRFLQGGFARFLSEAPIVGAIAKPAIEAANADLTAPVAKGGAGVALQQNPTGPITIADFQAGERQQPSYAYPLEVQAQMIRDGLARGAQTAPAAAPSGNGWSITPVK